MRDRDLTISCNLSIFKAEFAQTSLKFLPRQRYFTVHATRVFLNAAISHSRIDSGKLIDYG